MKKLKKIIKRSSLVLILVSICVSMSFCSNGKSQFVNERPTPGFVTCPNLFHKGENNKQNINCAKRHSKEDTIYDSFLKESNDTLYLKRK